MMVPEVLNLRNELQNAGIFLEKCTPATLPVEYIDVQLCENKFEDDSVHTQLKCDGLSHPFQRSLVVTVPLLDAKILYDGGTDFKKLVEISLPIENVMDYKFSAGDAIGILVSNSSKDVERVFSSLQSGDVWCEISIKAKTTKKNAKLPQHIPHISSARAILRDCLDLRSVPKKLFLRSLAEYTTDVDEKHFLISVSSKEGSKLYNELILDKARNFLDVLQLCPSCVPPLSLLIEHLPRLKSRPYSVANSPVSGKVKIIFSVLPENTGVASGYLTNLAEQYLENPNSPPEVNFYFREINKFRYSDEDANMNSILIAIGCGVSPFLGFLEHKEHLMEQNNTDIGDTWLFVGSICQENSVYREHLLHYKRKNVLQELYESFSRDSKCDFKHVQDQMKANATEFVSQFLKKETILYVCADGTTISKSIEECIRQCLVKVLECSESDADALIKESRVSGKYREDLWL